MRRNKKMPSKRGNTRKFSGNYKTGKGSRIRDDYSVTEKDVKESSNDPAWYASNPEILRDAASYPFSYNTGATEMHDYSVWATPASRAWNARPPLQVPGVMSFNVVPTVGTASEATDPINVAAQSVYSFVRHANSGHSNYDATNLMMYILAMANFYSFLVWCQRLYGYALTYDQRNRYIPDSLVDHNKVDVNDLRNNLATFRFWINTLIAKAVSFAVPATMSIFSRMTFLYSDYYIEGTSIKEQMYQYVPVGFYKYGIDSSTSLGTLTFVPITWLPGTGNHYSIYTGKLKVSELMLWGDDMFNAIWSQEDFGIMSGDILKAYGDNIIKLTPIPEYYQIAPKFDPMVLTQLKNADLVRFDCTATIRITENTTTGIINQVLNPKGYISGVDKYYWGHNGITDIASFNGVMNAVNKDYRILTVDTDNPTPEIVIEATRLKVAYDPNKSWYKAGTEIVPFLMVSVAPGTTMICEGINGIAQNDTQCHFDVANIVSAMRNFHYAPRFYFVYVDSASTPNINVIEHFDVDNFTLLDYTDVKKLHEAATINMFAVPSIGKVLQ